MARIDFTEKVNTILQNKKVNKHIKVGSIKDIIGKDDLDFSGNVNDEKQNFSIPEGNYEQLVEWITNYIEVEVPRFDLLNQYYKGHNVSIYDKSTPRRVSESNSDTRYGLPIASAITQTQTGYSFANPPKIIINKDINTELQERLNNVIRNNNFTDLILESATINSKFGRSYVLAYIETNDITEELDIKFTNLDVKDVFDIYDNTVAKNKLATVRFIYDDFQEKVIIYIYVGNSLITITSEGSVDETTGLIDSVGDIVSSTIEATGFTKIPIITIFNNEDRTGDYENAITYIDAYDGIMTDTINSTNDSINDILWIDGDLADMSADDFKKMQDGKILLTKPMKDVDYEDSKSSHNAKVEFVSRNVQFSPFKDQLETILDNIMLITNTPNLKDSSFGGTQTGTSLEFKLNSLNQTSEIKTKMMRAGYIDLLVLSMSNIIDNFNNEDIYQLKLTTDIKFSRNVPTSKFDQLKLLTEAGMVLSQESLLSLADFVDNPQEELERVSGETTQEQ